MAEISYYKYGSMNNWRAKRIAKKHKGSQTPGKTKGERCVTDPLKKFFACSPKAYKHPQYEEWNKKFKGYAGVKS